MKNLMILIIVFLNVFTAASQEINDIDEVTTFHEDLAAVRKGDQWAFIDNDGNIIIDYRDDLVSGNTSDELGVGSVKYPIFNENRCLIKKDINGITYYGFIDRTGKIVVEPSFLNATNFNDGYALVIKFEENVMGSNKVLGKKIINNKLEEYVIDVNGNLVKYLENPRNCISSDMKKKCDPKFESKFIAPHLVAVKGKNLKWKIFKF